VAHLLVLMLVAVVCAGAARSPGDAAAGGGRTPPLPSIEGPIAGEGMYLDPLEQNYPVSAAELGYTFEEYFVSGTAAGEPYTARLLVARPDDLDGGLFSGNVLVEPMHATGIPFLWNFTREYLASQGHAAVEVSLIPSTVENRLKAANPERYAELRVVDGQASDIFAQVGRLLKSGRTPLPGAERLYMTGHSMASGPVWRYMDTHHDRYRLRRGRPIYDGFFPETTRTASSLGPFPEVDVPTVLLNSELEVQAVLVEQGIDYRRPDSDEPGEQFRLYEVAGMPHNPVWRHPVLAGVDHTCAQPPNDFPYEAMVSTAFDHLVGWVEDGTSPPRAERITVEGDPSRPTAIARDEHGNALGGVRTTTMDVPVATRTGMNSGDFPGVGDCGVFGSQRNFSGDQLRSLYGNHARYVNRVNQRLNELVDEGWVLPEMAPAIRRQAQEFTGFG
jgi:Alpha/beta hydrolase domain